MAFARPSLSDLRSLVSADVSAALPGADALLRFSNLAVLAAAMAGLAHGHYGYLDWISLQAVPATATDEYLEGWAALKGVTRKPSAAAVGQATFATIAGTMMPAGTSVTRSDGALYATTADVTATGATITVPLQAVAPGVAGNADPGTTMLLTTGIANINSTGSLAGPAAGGADIEDDDSLRSRMLAAYASPPQGGNAADFVQWALAVPGVTRAWVAPAVMGPGTISVLFMMDDAEHAHGGFPQGANGVAAAETRDIAATGDQLAVANALFAKAPLPTLVYAVAPTGNPIALTIAGLSGVSSTVKAAIANAIANAMLRSAVPGGVTPLSAIEAAIAGVTGASGFVITAMSCPAGTISPAGVGNITSNPGALPSVGVITYI